MKAKTSSTCGGFETDDSIEQVIAHLHAAEVACGRPRNAPKWAPRAMDLDLLLFGNSIREDLRLPRADLVKRPYMLRPLAALAPTLIHPISGTTMAELWKQFDQGLRVHASFALSERSRTT